MGFTVGSAIYFGWETFWRRPWLFVLAALILTLVELALEILAGMIAAVFASSEKEPLITFFIAYLALGIAIGTFAAMGWTAFFLAAHDNPDTVKLSDLWHPRPYWRYLGAGILLLLAMLAGFPFATLLVLASVPLGLFALVIAVVGFVIVSLMFMFALMIVIDRELDPISAMKEIYRITLGHKWRLFCLSVVFMLISLLWQSFNKMLGDPTPINLLGALAIVAALLFLWPIAALAVTRAYRVLSGGAVPRPADASLAA